MKLIHLSDLHLGKKLGVRSLQEDQEYIMKQIIDVIDEEKPFGVIIAGDVYNKSVPQTEAIKLFDSFLTELSNRKINVFIISGNHDSAERLAFGSELMKKSGIYFSPAYCGNIEPLTFADERGEVDFYLLPYVKPATVRPYAGDTVIESYTEAVKFALPQVDKSKRNVLVAHQFITGAELSESEELFVGGSENVDGSIFEDFDYVALGHIHSAQSCGNKKIRYCGTPLKYAFAEAKHKKSLTVVELLEKGNIDVRTVPLVPLRDVQTIKGNFDQIMTRSFYENTSYTFDYLYITLTDENIVPNAIHMLKTVYRNLIGIGYENVRTSTASIVEATSNVEEKDRLELFDEFYTLQNGMGMSEEQKEFMRSLINEIWSEEV